MPISLLAARQPSENREYLASCKDMRYPFRISSLNMMLSIKSWSAKCNTWASTRPRLYVVECFKYSSQFIKNYLEDQMFSNLHAFDLARRQFGRIAYSP